MTNFRLGLNNCFAVKRWPEPEAWTAVVRDELGLDLVQHSLDLVDLSLPQQRRIAEAAKVRAACSAAGLTLHSTFTGLAAYSYNLLLDPGQSRRTAAEQWFMRAIQYTAAVGARATGGHLGAYSARDWNAAERREELGNARDQAMRRLAAGAAEAGLAELYVENLAGGREPCTIEAVEELLDPGDAGHVPVRLCLDVGHMCAPGAGGRDIDPYAWLEHFAREAPVIHLQQSDAAGDHHWPFTQQFNSQGRIEADRVIAALVAGGADQVDLLLEVIHPFEAGDDDVLEDLRASVGYWRDWLDR